MNIGTFRFRGVCRKNKQPTSGPEPLTSSLTSDNSNVAVVYRGLQIPHIQRGFLSLPCACCTVLSSRWYQSGIKDALFPRRLWLPWGHPLERLRLQFGELGPSLVGFTGDSSAIHRRFIATEYSSHRRICSSLGSVERMKRARPSSESEVSDFDYVTRQAA